MASNNPPPDGLADDFFEQILAVPSYATDGCFGGGDMGAGPMGLQLGSGDGGDGSGHGGGGGGYRGMSSISSISMPLGLNLEQGFLKPDDASSSSVKRFRDDSAAAINETDPLHLTSLFPAFGHLQAPAIRPPLPPPAAAAHPPLHQAFHNQLAPRATHPPAIRPRVRARRGQATDPHSIAERLRRERIAERMKALQDLVPNANKTDRAAMLDEIVDYVKFLRLQVKVLSMSRLGGSGAVAQLVADVPSSSNEGDGVESSRQQQGWEKWSTDGIEQQVAKLMQEDIGAAMQFLQSKALCIMPISLAGAIFGTHHHPDEPSNVMKPESNTPSP